MPSINKLIKDKKLLLIISPKHKKHYVSNLQYTISSINKDIANLSYFLKQIPNCSLSELNNMSSILDNKFLFFKTIVGYHYNNNFTDVKLKIVTPDYDCILLKAYIKIGKRCFNFYDNYIPKKEILYYLINHDRFDLLSGKEQSKLILKCFCVSKDQYDKENLLKDLKSQEAKDTLSKILVLG